MIRWNNDYNHGLTRLSCRHLQIQMTAAMKAMGWTSGAGRRPGRSGSTWEVWMRIYILCWEEPR